MSDVAIRVENLSKRFILGERIGIKTFRETLQDLFTAPFRRWVKNNGELSQEKVDTDKVIWALKDVSFEVKHGEVLGIIGPNGAGKSTLLKILSRITEPTAGYAEIRGRVGSLLEVGTGFHPELTGRENIYLNGAILGMSKAEIRRKFDDIVSFAGVEKFIDTPVKRYSSGMQVRLAFAVAAHLEPEILIVDEVLAVGDAEFQKRCLGKMDEVSRSGRTILFVSHNLAAIEGLCTSAAFIMQGRIIYSGTPRHTVEYYERQMARPESALVDLRDHPNRDKSSQKIMVFARLCDARGAVTNIFPLKGTIVLSVWFSSQTPFKPVLGVVVRTASGLPVFGADNRLYSRYLPNREYLKGVISCELNNLPLTPGTYFCDLYLGDQWHSLDRVMRAISFEIRAADVLRSGKLPYNHCGYVIHDDIRWWVSETDEPT